jgi:hypothetical protein
MKSTCHASGKCTYTIPEGQGYSFWQRSTENPLAFMGVSDYIIPHYNESKYVFIDGWLMVNNTASPSATACGLWFCVQAYGTKVTKRDNYADHGWKLERDRI